MVGTCRNRFATPDHVDDIYRLFAIFSVRYNLAGDQNIRPQFRARPVPMVNKLMDAFVAPVMDVMTGACGFNFITGNPVVYLGVSIGYGNQPGKIIAFFAKIKMSCSGPPTLESIGNFNIQLQVM